jgi:hypothetical protein
VLRVYVLRPLDNPPSLNSMFPGPESFAHGGEHMVLSLDHVMYVPGVGKQSHTHILLNFRSTRSQDCECRMGKSSITAVFEFELLAAIRVGPRSTLGYATPLSEAFPGTALGYKPSHLHRLR